jgi:FkbM family methyltransferase
MTSLRLFFLKVFLRFRLHLRLRGGWRFCRFLAEPFRSLPLYVAGDVPVYVNIQSLDDHAVSLLLRNSSYHEEGEQKVLRSLIREGDTVYDIGANMGLFTTMFSAAVGPRGLVVAVEPNPSLTENLARTARSLSNVRLHPCALAAERGTATFYVPADDHMLASLANWSGQTVNEISIPVDTLDHISAAHSAPALVKIDVEGAEDLVLQGGTQLLQSPTPPIIFFEQVPKAATAFGYDPCATQRRIRETGQFTLYHWCPN